MDWPSWHSAAAVAESGLLLAQSGCQTVNNRPDRRGQGPVADTPPSVGAGFVLLLFRALFGLAKHRPHAPRHATRSDRLRSCSHRTTAISSANMVLASPPLDRTIESPPPGQPCRGCGARSFSPETISLGCLASGRIGHGDHGKLTRT
jgi:hypothetical protein